MTTVALERRAREARSRAAVRAWQYRQRHHAHGVWFGLRRILTQAAEAYAIDAVEAGALLDEGMLAEPVGSKLEPPKTVIFVPQARLATLVSRRALPLRLGGEMLEARCIALVRW